MAFNNTLTSNQKVKDLLNKLQKFDAFRFKYTTAQQYIDGHHTTIKESQESAYLRMEHTNTLRQFKQRVEESNKQKTKKQKRQDKINKLSSLDKHWKGLEHIDHSQLTKTSLG